MDLTLGKEYWTEFCLLFATVTISFTALAVISYPKED
jgi:hypothetical protein